MAVPVVRRQMLSEPPRLVVTILAVAAAIALVLLLAGLRRGMGEQVTLYLDRQAPVLVGQAGCSQLPLPDVRPPRERHRPDRRVPGVAETTPDQASSTRC